MSDLQSLLERLKGADRYAKLRTIPDYLEEIGRSTYINPHHPYTGQVKAANREYAEDLRALLAERDSLLQALIASKSPSEPSA